MNCNIMPLSGKFLRTVSGFLSALLVYFLCFSVNAHALSIEDEAQAGEAFLSQIRYYRSFVETDFTDKYLNDLGRWLIKHIDAQPFTFNFYIINDPSINAFAAPGGHIFLCSGLITASDSLDETASVLAHELGHVTARHISNRIDQNMKLGIATMAAVLAGVFLGGDVGQAIVTGSMAANIQAQLNYSRSDERQADQLGLGYMEASGVDPRGFVSIMSKIQRSQWYLSSHIPSYLMTHPSGPERMATLESMMKLEEGRKNDLEIQRLRNLFPVFQAIVLANTASSEMVRKFFGDVLSKSPDDPVANLAMGLYYNSANDFIRAIPAFKRALNNIDAAMTAHMGLAEAYHSVGDSRNAMSELEYVISKAPDNFEARFMLGVVNEESGRYEEALKSFMRLASYEPVNPKIYHHIGICYGRMDNLGMAHYYFGRSFILERNFKQAIFHFTKAKEHAGDDQSLIKKIDGELSALGKGPKKK